MNHYAVADDIINRAVKKRRRRAHTRPQEPVPSEAPVYAVSLEEIAARQIARGLDLIFGLEPATSRALEASKFKRTLEEL